MFKRIRDYIYDINDIFIALMIIIVAAGIIVWRSTMIMSYPEYLSAKEAAASNTVTPIENTQPGGSGTSNTGSNTINTSPNTGSENTTENTGTGNSTENTAGQNTVENQGGQSQEGQTGQAQEGQGGTEQSSIPVVRADITIEYGFRGTWYTVADRLIEAGVLSPEDRNPFVNTVEAMDLSRYLQIGTFTVSSDMSDEQMIRCLCGQD